MWKINMRIRILILLMSFLLSGCFSAKVYKIDGPEILDMKDSASPVTIVKIKDYISVKDDLSKISDSEQIDILYYQQISVRNFFLSLSGGNRNFVIDVDPGKMITVPRWKGSFKGLLLSLQMSSGLFYYEIGENSYLVKDKATCSVRVLFQNYDTEIIDLLNNTFNVDDVFLDRVSGQVVFNADSMQYLQIVEYFKKMPVSFITIDVAFLESSMESSNKVGLDIQKLKASIESPLKIPGSVISISGDNGFSLNVNTGSVNLTAVIQSLQKDNDMTILQRSSLGTLAGREVVLDVSQKVPYVDTITSTAGQSGAAVRGYTFKEETSGTMLKITAVSDTDIVSIQSDLKFQEITDYLNVGSGTDTISRPIVSVRNLKSILSVVPGSVVKLASFRYKRKNQEQSGLYGVPSLMKGAGARVFELNVLARIDVKKYVFE